MSSDGVGKQHRVWRENEEPHTLKLPNIKNAEEHFELYIVGLVREPLQSNQKKWNLFIAPFPHKMPIVYKLPFTVGDQSSGFVWNNNKTMYLLINDLDPG